MARVCDFCGKHTAFGRSITRRGKPVRQGGIGLKTTGISKRRFKPNLHSMRALVDGKVVRVRVCMGCLRAGRVKKP